ncbi:hypothetical protein, partial [Klebsiella pneumoniae]|uniref:hypothetical protein n=1 Tax=Klebsiella pneumoniae TaxID=573 RepID=UPI0025A19438
GKVTASHTMTYTNQVEVVQQNSVRYLHIAAVDVAGNIGPTTNISISLIADSGDIEVDADYPANVPI